MKNKSIIRRIGNGLIGNKNIRGMKKIFRSWRIKNLSKKGRDRSQGFLHIPKTGGSAFSGFSRDMAKAGYIMPVRFGHAWTLENIVQSFPGTKVSFMVRDPLERTVSAFNSRLRQGRPRYSNNWSTREAVAFSLFSDAETFLRALISEEDHDISAVQYALRNITHLRWNYHNYFENTAKIRRYRGSIQLVGETNNSLPFWKKLSAQVNIPPEIVTNNFKREHVSKISSHSILSGFSSVEIDGMRRALNKEYKIYNALKELVNC